MTRPPAYLFVGPEELLLRRAAERLLDELRAAGELEVTEVRAADVREGGLPDLRTASLFGGARALVVREAQDLPPPAVRALLEELSGSPPDATVVLCATGTRSIQKLAKRIGELGGRVAVEPPKEWDRRGWTTFVADEFRRHDRAAGRAAVEAVLGHAGHDIGTVVEKVAQVAAATPPGEIDADHVEAVVVGHGSQGSFAIADAMCARDPARALTLLRGALEAGDDPVMVLGALVYRIRSIVAVAANVDSVLPGVRVSAGQRRHVEAARRNFGPGELTRAYRTLADADLEIKSGELPPRFVIERAVVAIATRP